MLCSQTRDLANDSNSVILCMTQLYLGHSITLFTVKNQRIRERESERIKRYRAALSLSKVSISDFGKLSSPITNTLT